MIYWQKSGKNTKSWPHLFNFECKQKILEVTDACQSILLSYLYISYLCEQTSMVLDFQMIILFVPSVASLSVAVNLKFCPCCPLLGCHALTIQLPVVHKIPHILTFAATSGFVHINFIWLLSKSWEQGSNANTGKKHLQAYLHYKQ